MERNFGRWVACLALLASVGLPSVWAGKKKSGFADWASGPIRYIARKAEIQTFRELDSPEDRALFIEKFWARRDPSPGTLANEYRQLFWERVAEANTLFLDSHKPGWKTDRGKIHVLYGPPTEIQEDLDLRTDGSPGGAHGVIRWIYEGRPDDRLDMDPIIVVPFTRSAVGSEWHISHDPELASVFWDPAGIRDREFYAEDRLLHSLATPRRSELSVMLDLGRMQEIPTQAQVLLERVETIEAYRTRPIDVLLSRYHDPGDRGVTVVVNVGIGEFGPDVRPSLVARFTTKDATRAPRVLGEDSFRIEGSGERRVAQARLVLDPQDYDVTIMALDPETAETGMFRGELGVVPPSDALRFSDVWLAEELRPLDYAGLVSYDEPFHIGPFYVVPRLDTAYRPGDDVQLFYEIYGGEGPYRVAYQLQGRDHDGSWVDLGRPSTGLQSNASQGWGLPTSVRWPPGDYRIRIDVEDAGARLISRYVAFTLEADGDPDAE